MKKYSTERERIEARRRQHRYALKNPKKIKERNRRYVLKNREKVRDWHRQWVKNNPEKVRIWHRQWVKNNPEKMRAQYKRTWNRIKGTEKIICRQKFSLAVQLGRVVRRKCFCGKIGEGHHADYSKPLKVKWLCRKHHLDLHRKLT